ncbi:MAG: hypothetical protein CMJ18_10270 [Phycisphaeraceae bacterium]|nr:hypothetical protein [Phycisphaeraceae bacterium]
MKRFATVLAVLVLAGVAGQALAAVWHQETFEEFNVGDGRAALVAAGWSIPDPDNPNNSQVGGFKNNDSVSIVAMNAPGGAGGSKALEMGWASLNKRVAAELERTGAQEMSAWLWADEMNNTARSLFAADLQTSNPSFDPGRDEWMNAQAGMAARTSANAGKNVSRLDLAANDESFEMDAQRWYRVLVQMNTITKAGTVTLYDDTGAVVQGPFTDVLQEGPGTFDSVDAVHMSAFLPGPRFVVDNIEFGDPIPEPAIIGMMAIGALGLIRRRRA